MPAAVHDAGAWRSPMPAMRRWPVSTRFEALDVNPLWVHGFPCGGAGMAWRDPHGVTRRSNNRQILRKPQNGLPTCRSAQHRHAAGRGIVPAPQPGGNDNVGCFGSHAGCGRQRDRRPAGGAPSRLAALSQRRRYKPGHLHALAHRLGQWPWLGFRRHGRRDPCARRADADEGVRDRSRHVSQRHANRLADQHHRTVSVAVAGRPVRPAQYPRAQHRDVLAGDAVGGAVADLGHLRRLPTASCASR